MEACPLPLFHALPFERGGACFKHSDLYLECKGNQIAPPLPRIRPRSSISVEPRLNGQNPAKTGWGGMSQESSKGPSRPIATNDGCIQVDKTLPLLSHQDSRGSASHPRWIGQRSVSNHNGARRLPNPSTSRQKRKPNLEPRPTRKRGLVCDHSSQISATKREKSNR